MIFSWIYDGLLFIFSWIYWWFATEQDDSADHNLTMDQHRALLSQNLHQEINRTGKMTRAQRKMAQRANKEAARASNPALRKDKKEIANYLKRTDPLFPPTKSQALHTELANSVHRCDARRGALERMAEVADEEAAEARQAILSRIPGEPVPESMKHIYIDFRGDHLILCMISEGLMFEGNEVHVDRVVDKKLPNNKSHQKSKKKSRRHPKFYKTPECNVCGMEYTQVLEELPVVLGCCHTICLPCAEELLKTNGHFYFIRCPSCRHDTILDEKLPEKFAVIDKDINAGLSEPWTPASSGCIIQ